MSEAIAKITAAIFFIGLPREQARMLLSCRAKMSTRNAAYLEIDELVDEGQNTFLTDLEVNNEIEMLAA